MNSNADNAEIDSEEMREAQALEKKRVEKIEERLVKMAEPSSIALPSELAEVKAKEMMSWFVGMDADE